MNKQSLTMDEIIIQTLEALQGAGLNNSSIWGTYMRCYRLLCAYFRKNHINAYGITAIQAYLQMQEERYHQGELSRHYFTTIRHTTQVLVDYVANDIIISSRLLKGTHFKVGEFYETVIDLYFGSREFHPNTRNDVEWAVRRFLYYLEQIGHYTFTCVTEEHVRSFLVAMSGQLAAGSLKNIMCYLSRFSEYLYDHGYASFLFSRLFQVKIRRENKIYSTLTDDELKKILAQIDTDTVMGKRDMAMILLGITTGMRAIDMINLRLCDIGWTKGSIRLVQQKTGRHVTLPLMANAGMAVKDYILNARPSSSSEYIFLTTKYPI